VTHALQFTCDVCGKQKGETNHWLLLLPPVDPGYDKHDDAMTVFALVPWHDGLAQELNVRHLCGAGCAAVALDRTLNPQPEAANG
jgi:hypothetical protein